MLSVFIGNGKLKLVEGFMKKDVLNIIKAVQADCDTKIVADGTINDSGSLQMMLNELVSTSGIKSKDLTVTVECGEIIVRDFKVPKLETAEIQSIVDEKITKILNKDDVDILTDFMYISDDAEEDLYNIMAYAVPAELVNSYMELAKSMKFVPRAFDTPENACVKLISGRLVNNEQQDGIMMLIDIGMTSITYYGFTGGVLTFCRKDISPVKTFFADVSVIKKSDEENAGNYLSELDFTPEHEHGNAGVDEYCKKLIYNLSDYITRYIQYLTFNSGASEGHLSKIHICGGISSKPGICTALEKSTGIPFEILRSVSGVTLPEGVPLNEFSDAVGAMMRR